MNTLIPRLAAFERECVGPGVLIFPASAMPCQCKRQTEPSVSPIRPPSARPARSRSIAQTMRKQPRSFFVRLPKARDRPARRVVTIQHGCGEKSTNDWFDQPDRMLAPNHAGCRICRLRRRTTFMCSGKSLPRTRGFRDDNPSVVVFRCEITH